MNSKDKEHNRMGQAIWILDTLLKNLLLVAVITGTVFVLFLLYDNYRVVQDADSSRYAQYKPTADDSLSFEELQAINPEVIGWLTLDKTEIDYPILQAEDNDKYLNTSVLGEFSLTGAIFLDYRNNPDFSDTLSIVYGHDMEADKMFGGFYEFEDPKYFQRHRTGTLFHDGEYYKLNIFAFLETSGYNNEVYNLFIGPQDYFNWLERIRPLFRNQAKSLPVQGPVMLMSSCEAGSTDGRLVLAATIRPGGHPPVKKDTSRKIRLVLPNLAQLPWGCYLLAGAGLLLLTVAYEKKKRHQ